MGLLERLEEAKQYRQYREQNGTAPPEPVLAQSYGGSGASNSQNNIIDIKSTQILTSQFCSLAKEAKWQTWLQHIVIDLHDDLIKCVTTSRSCRANSDKMFQILNELIIRGESDKLIEFLKTEYPNVIKN